MKKIFLILFLFFPFFVFAQGGIVIPNPLKATTVEAFIEDLIDVIFYLAVAIAPLMWIIAGFLLGVSAGDPEKIQRAKNIALYTAIGFFIVMLAKALVSVVRRVIT
jgi:ABC-type multidrug transport system permease subunit